MSDMGSNLPTFLSADSRTPPVLRDLLVEAEGCLQNGYLTGATACARRALDMLLTAAKADGPTYQARVHSLHEKHAVPQMLTSVLVQCGDASAREGSKLTTQVLQLYVVAIQAVVFELYVIGPERMERLQYVSRLVESLERAQGEVGTEAVGAH